MPFLIKLKIALLTCFMPLLLQGQIVSDFAYALQNGDAEKLAALFESPVSITLPNQHGAYSKAQAKQIVLHFFSQNEPTGISIEQEKTNKNTQQAYIIAIYTTKNHKYRVFAAYNKEGEKKKIQIIRFEKMK